MKKHSVSLALLAVFVMVALDQLVKWLVVQNMALGDHISLLPFLSLYHTQNTGIAFSMLSSFHDLGLIAITLVVIALVVWLWWSSDPAKKLANFGYLLVIGGALGNLIDRARLHYVTDYVLFHVGNWSFAVFNLADAFITMGAICIILNELVVWRHDARNDGKKN